MSAANLIHQLRQVSLGLWLALLIIWAIGALRTKPTVARQTTASHVWQRGIMLLGFYVLAARWVPAWFNYSMIRVTPCTAIAGVAITLLGLGLSIWARILLGGNWSSAVELKLGHTLVRRGPYRIVRHPIYTGLLLAIIGAFLEYGHTRIILALVVFGVAFWLKARIEEGFMKGQFGEEYVRYCHEVRSLVPFVF